MKSAADQYAFFRWKSSRGRLVVRTTWVKGVRHVVLSDDDNDDDRRRQLKTSDGPRRRRLCDGSRELGVRDRSPSTGMELTTYIPVSNENIEPTAFDYDEDYTERVLQWLHKPFGMLQTRQIPVSAPCHNNDHGSARRPALVKTCSIPENCKFGGGLRATEVAGKRPATFTRKCRTNRHKTELHVHMPSMQCLTNDDGGTNIRDNTVC